MPPREPLSLRATDHGVIAQEYTNGGRALLFDLDMEYEKAYKAVLQTAKQWIKDGCTDKEKICLECVFPELRESEDERIRKWLVDYFSSIKETMWIHRDISCEQILAYLEKQEQKPAWSEEDERIRKLLIWQVHRNIEDETNDLAQSVYDGIKGHDPDLEESIEDWKKCLAWIKSLPMRCPKSSDNWKPSDEQLNALNFAITYFIHDTSYKNPTELRELYEQLKKL